MSRYIAFLAVIFTASPIFASPNVNCDDLLHSPYVKRTKQKYSKVVKRLRDKLDWSQERSDIRAVFNDFLGELSTMARWLDDEDLGTYVQLIVEKDKAEHGYLAGTNASYGIESVIDLVEDARLRILANDLPALVLATRERVSIARGWLKFALDERDPEVLEKFLGLALDAIIIEQFTGQLLRGELGYYYMHVEANELRDQFYDQIERQQRLSIFQDMGPDRFENLIL
jgi:hypothetical protein